MHLELRYIDIIYSIIYNPMQPETLVDVVKGTSLKHQEQTLLTLKAEGS
jgi:hypothetical protein